MNAGAARAVEAVTIAHAATVRTAAANRVIRAILDRSEEADVFPGSVKPRGPLAGTPGFISRNDSMPEPGGGDRGPVARLLASGGGVGSP